MVGSVKRRLPPLRFLWERIRVHFFPVQTPMALEGEPIDRVGSATRTQSTRRKQNFTGMGRNDGASSWHGEGILAQDEAVSPVLATACDGGPRHSSPLSRLTAARFSRQHCAGNRFGGEPHLKRSNRWRVIILGASAALLIGLYGTNASWLVAAPHGVPRVVAQRGVAQQYLSVGPDDAACTARLILPPAHSFIDNTLASIEAARAAGADVVEIDVRITKDRQFVVFHDRELACRTEGSGPVSEHSVAGGEGTGCRLWLYGGPGEELSSSRAGSGSDADSGRGVESISSAAVPGSDQRRWARCGRWPGCVPEV